MADEKIKVSKIGGRNWAIIILLGLAGQIAWNVENSWFNTFVYDTITPDPKPIAWMVAISAITATITTLIMGTASDRIGKRKPFIFYGYILWGISTVIFPTTAFIKATSTAILMVILVDAVMTFFGSTAYDSAFNAWTTDISDNTNRGILSGVLSILPLLAALIGSGLSGILIDNLGYYTFFYTLGALVSVMGIIGGLLLRDSNGIQRKAKNGTKSFIIQLFDVFRLESIKKNREIFLVFSAIALFSIAVQVFLPYQMIYMNNYLNISKTTAGIITAVPVLIAMIVAVPVGRLADRGYISKLTLFAPILAFAGLILFSFSLKSYQIIVTGSLIYIGYVVLILSSSAWMKNLMPEDKRGQFEGVRMIFNVAIPMVIGPAIGSFLITHYGIPTTLNGETGFIPTPIVFQTAGLLCITTLIPIAVIIKKRKNQRIGLDMKDGDCIGK